MGKDKVALPFVGWVAKLAVLPTKGRIVRGVVAVLLVVCVLQSCGLQGQSPGSPGSKAQSAVPNIASQKQGGVTVYSVTPQGGPPPAVTPEVNPGGPMILTPPLPAFYLAGDVYRNNDVYRADTGLSIRQYLKELGDVEIYRPVIVRGVLYMAVRTSDSSQGPGKMVMYAVRASDGIVLWKWGDCGQSVNMSSPIIVNGSVYFACEAAPAVYRLYALRASSGTRLWLDTFDGEVSSDLLGDQSAIYIQLGDQLLAERADTGALLWKRRFEADNYYIGQADLGNGIIYMTQRSTFYAIKTSDGTPLWEYQFSGDYAHLDMILAENEVYLFAHEWSRPTNLYALMDTTGTLVWQRQLSDANSNALAVDQGNLYLLNNVFASQQPYAQPLKRTLTAIQGSDGRMLWQQDIPWNKGKLEYAMIEVPRLSAGGGAIYLVDWAHAENNPQDAQATMGAFSEHNGALLWTRNIA